MSTQDFKNNRTKQKAWVVFSGQTELFYLKWLKPGFRHCYILLHDGKHWVSIDPLSQHTEVQVLDTVPADFDLPGWLESRGQTILRADIDHTHIRPAPWMAFTCVEAVKRVLGLHKFNIFTPWQLFRYLKRESRENFQPLYKGDLAWAV